MEEDTTQTTSSLSSISGFMHDDIPNIGEYEDKTRGQAIKEEGWQPLENRVKPYPPDANISSHHKVSYLLEELMDVCTNNDARMFLVQDYESYCIELSVCGAEITETIENYMHLCLD